MSELDKVVIDEVDEAVEPVENEFSPAEEKAMASGWRPEEEWTGDADDWIDAKTFNRNGEFMSRIQHQTKELTALRTESDKLKEGMKSLGEHNKKIAEQEYKNAVASLKKEKVTALEEDDHASVVEIDDKIDELKEAKREMDTTSSEELHDAAKDVAANPAFIEWSETNSWYGNDVILRGAADAVGMEFIDANPGIPIEDLLDHVTKKMKEEFPSKFGNAKKSKPTTVTESGGTGRKPKKAKYTVKDLDDEQKQFAKMFVETGAFESEQEYVDSLAKSGDL